MPGIVALASLDRPRPLSRILKEMLSGFVPPREGKKETYLSGDQCFALGCFLDTQVNPYPHLYEDRDGAAILDGEFYGRQEVRDDLTKEGITLLREHDSEVLAWFLRKRPLNAFAGLDGTFSFVCYDRRQDQLLAGNDRYGNQPLYYHWKGGFLLLASELKALGASRAVPPEIQEPGLADTLSFGYPMRQKTLIKGVLRIPPASVLSFGRTGIRIQRYWKPSFAPEPGIPVQQHLSEVEELFQSAIRRQIRGRAGLSLSGGLSSRAIAAVAGNVRSGIPSFTHGLVTGADVRIAKRLAPVCGCEHHVIPLDGVFLKNYPLFAEELIYRSEGVPGILGTYLIPSFRYQQEHADVVLDGTGEEVGRRWLFKRWAPFLPDDSSLAERTYRIMSMLPDYRSFIAPGLYFRLETAALAAIADQYREIGPAGSVADKLDTFFLLDRFGNYLSMGFNFEKTFLRCRQPFLDYAVVDRTLRVPTKIRLRSLLASYIVRKNNPKAAELPLVHGNHLVPFGSEAARYAFVGAYRAADCLLTPWGLRTGLPFADYEPWLRHPLRDFIRNNLLGINLPFCERAPLETWTKRFFEKRQSVSIRALETLVSHALWRKIVLGAWPPLDPEIL